MDNEGSTYTRLEDLDAYRLARQYSTEGWNIYSRLSWQLKKIIGVQMITSIDSVGANIAEGYGRFHYLDKNKFYYNARASLFESQHWNDLLLERKIISQEEHAILMNLKIQIGKRINGLINSQYQRKNQS